MKCLWRKVAAFTLLYGVCLSSTTNGSEPDGSGISEGEPTDFLFVIDRTAADADGQRLENCTKHAMVQIVQNLGARVRADDVRIAAVSFGGNAGKNSIAAARIHFDFMASQTATGVENNIDRADFSTSYAWADPSSAFRIARTQLFADDTETGFRHHQVPLVLLVLTSGDVSGASVYE